MAIESRPYVQGGNRAPGVDIAVPVETNSPGAGGLDTPIVHINDGANVAQGGINDAESAVGGTGSLSAKLRRITTQLANLVVGWAQQLDRNNDEVRVAAIEELNPATFRPLISDAEGRQITRPWGADTWSQGHAPGGGNTQATTTKAAGGAGRRHICTGIVATLAAGATAPAAAVVSLFLRDGASGSGTVIGAAFMSVPAVAGQGSSAIVMTGLNIRGSVNTAMCLEFGAAAGANTFEGVWLMGVTVDEA